MPRARRLPRAFFTGPDVVGISRDFLGKVLCTRIGGHITSGIIVETEAYHGPEDRGSHAYGMRRTPRTEPMYRGGGFAYIYLCYGIHHLFNVVTGQQGIPHAVLIRGLEPLEGIDIMQSRRNLEAPKFNMTAGPGALATALGLTTDLTGIDLLDKHSPVWIEDRGIRYPDQQVTAGPRVGMNFEGKYKTIPWRFYVAGNPWVSPARPRPE